MFRGALARAGVFAFVVLGLLPFLRPSSGGEARSISVAQAFPTAAVVSVEIRPERVRDVARAAVVLGEQATPAPTAQAEPTATPEPTPVPSAPPPARPAVTLPPLPDPPTAGIVIASWYGLWSPRAKTSSITPSTPVRRFSKPPVPVPRTMTAKPWASKLNLKVLSRSSGAAPRKTSVQQPGARQDGMKSVTSLVCVGS